MKTLKNIAWFLRHPRYALSWFATGIPFSEHSRLSDNH